MAFSDNPDFSIPVHSDRDCALVKLGHDRKFSSVLVYCLCLRSKLITGIVTPIQLILQ